MAQPRRDSKSLGEDTAGSSPARSLSSALRPSFFRSAASVVKPGLNEGVQFEHGKTTLKPGCSPLQLSADRSKGQTCSLHNSVSAIPVNVSLDSSPDTAAMPVPSGLPVEVVTEDVDTIPDRQATPVEDLEHQQDQVHSLIKSLPGPCVAGLTQCCSKVRTRDSALLSPSTFMSQHVYECSTRRFQHTHELDVTESCLSTTHPVLCDHAPVWCQCIHTEGQCAESETGCQQKSVSSPDVLTC